MRDTTTKLAAPFVAAGMIAMCLSCGPREQTRDNAGTIAAAQEARPEVAAAIDPPEDEAVIVESLSADAPVAADSVEPAAAASDPASPQSQPTPVTAPKKPASLPRLVDLGADKCIPCKMMAPILAELKGDYAGQFEVHFVDVWKDPAPGRAYGIKVIPTQIFFDASGVELWRHEGFFGKDDILKKWAELGVALKPPTG